MSRQNFIFTSESVSEGHPDKVCDRISDAVLDAFLAEEPQARVACETFATSGLVVVGGEVGLENRDIRAIVEPYIRESLPADWLTAKTEWHVNPTGTFVIGGPDGDAGLTGRKIIVDTYGGSAPHGGGAFSGKDPTKVDRSAAYAARYLAKNIVAAGLAKRCLLQLSYAIGVSKPLSIYCDTFGTGEVPDEVIEAVVPKVMDLSPRGIREHLSLNRPIYQRTSAYGHFGRAPEADGGFSWEKTDLAGALKAEV